MHLTLAMCVVVVLFCLDVTAGLGYLFRREHGPCKMQNATGEVLEERRTCPRFSPCSVGPVDGDIEGEAVQVFFCDTRRGETTPEELELLQLSLLCNACQLSENSVVVESRSCFFGRACTEGNFNVVNVDGNNMTALFCAPVHREFSLLNAFGTCRNQRWRGWREH